MPQPRAELVVDLAEPLVVRGREELPAGRSRDQLQGLRARRDAKRLRVTAGKPVLDDAGRRSEQDRVDGNVQRSRAPGGRQRRSAAAVARAVRDQQHGRGRDDADDALLSAEARGEHDCVADRRPFARVERLERRADQLSVAGRRDGDLRARRERHDAHAEFVGHFGGEAQRRRLRRLQACRQNVRRSHRSRYIDREQDRRLFAADGHRRVRPCDSDDHRGKSGEQDRERKMASHTGSTVDEVRDERRRSPHCRGTSPGPLARDVDGE